MRAVPAGWEDESSVGIFSFALSPDGRSIAFTTSAQDEDVFVARSDGSEVRQLTNDAARDRHPAWSPDGKTIYFYSNRAGGYQVWNIREERTGDTDREGFRVEVMRYEAIGARHRGKCDLFLFGHGEMAAECGRQRERLWASPPPARSLRRSEFARD